MDGTLRIDMVVICFRDEGCVDSEAILINEEKLTGERDEMNSGRTRKGSGKTYDMFSSSSSSMWNFDNNDFASRHSNGTWRN
jgi:hypothetical protein